MLYRRRALQFVLGLGLLVSVCSVAQTDLGRPITEPVTQDDALLVAQYYTAHAPPPDLVVAEASLSPEEQTLPLTDPSGRILAWIFPLLPRGFLVITADRRIEPLIAYSVESDFPWESDEENALKDVLIRDIMNRLVVQAPIALESSLLHCAKRAHIESYVSRRRYGFAGPLLASLACAPSDPPSKYHGTDPIIEFPNDWHQQSPYNAYCPPLYGSPGCYPADQSYGGSRCKTGCVALALAQILYHHEHPDAIGPAQTRQYTCSGMKCSLPSLAFAYDSPAEDVVPLLCFAAGASVETDYGYGGSGADFAKAADALATVWGYECQLEGLTSMSASSLLASLFQDMMPSHESPALLELLGQSWRHATVVDAVRFESIEDPDITTSYFHLRMGNREGGVTAWYTLSEKCPEGCSVISELILHIAPKTEEAE